jgi:spore maturation protein CgeB
MVLRGGFFFQDELCKAVEALGLSSCPIYYEEYGPEELSQIIEERVAKQKPDLMISVGFKGIDPEGQVLQIARRLGVPVAVWFVDDPRPNCLAFRDNIDANIHAFCWEKHYLEWLEEKGFASVSFLPLAACSSVFDRGIQASSVEPEGLSFTGSAMGESYLAGIRRNFMWDESLTAEVQRRARDLLSGGLNVHTVSKEPLPFTDEKNLSWYSSLVIHTASGMLRRSTCSHLLGRDLVLVGDREGWHAALGSQVTALPDVDYATQLPDIYRQYAINLNITSCQMPSAVNQRLFDAPLGGGFVVTDMKQDAADLFVVDKEVIVYRDLLELDDLVSFYLSRPEQRVKVIEAARLRILAEHKVEHRLATILQRIEKG